MNNCLGIFFIYINISIEADNEEEAERLVEAKVKELMYGGPYYTVTDEEDD